MIQTSNYANAAISYDSEVFKSIHLPNKNIAIYKRCIAPLYEELEIAASKTIECRVTETKEEVQSGIKDYFSTQLSKSKLLLQDILSIFELFEKNIEAHKFRILLTTVSTNMCRKFHTDINDLRLLCTYMDLVRFGYQMK